MRLLTLLLLSICVWLTDFARAEDSGSVNREFQLKTAYLFHFAELAQWPNTVQINICLQGNSPLRAYLPVLEGQPINGQAVHVDLTGKPNIERCSILFLSDPGALTPALAEQARLQHILLVGDAEDFAYRGGMVQFTLRDNRLKLVVNLAAIRSADIKLSSKLLRMAEIIE